MTRQSVSLRPPGRTASPPATAAIARSTTAGHPEWLRDVQAAGNRAAARQLRALAGALGTSTAPFSHVTNADSPSGSYGPGTAMLEDEERPEERAPASYGPSDAPLTIGQPESEVPASYLPPTTSAAPVTGQPAAGQPVTGQPVPGAPSSSLPSTPPAHGSLPATGGAPELPITAGLHYKLDGLPKQGAVNLTTNIFGLTQSEVATANMHIDKMPTFDAFVVNGDMMHKITWDVWEGLGPRDQVDVTSENDPDITAANYREVAADLKPGLGSVPPREAFFASDLTKRHERFHVRRHMLYYKEALRLGMRWLNKRTARSTAEVVDLTQKALTRIDEYGQMKTSPNLGSEENDAYEDGAPLYQARSDEILRKGRAGEYP